MGVVNKNIHLYNGLYLWQDDDIFLKKELQHQSVTQDRKKEKKQVNLKKQG